MSILSDFDSAFVFYSTVFKALWADNKAKPDNMDGAVFDYDTCYIEPKHPEELRRMVYCMERGKE
jgi:predicted enzyme related to lactoylglutathione lyase